MVQNRYILHSLARSPRTFLDLTHNRSHHGFLPAGFLEEFWLRFMFARSLTGIECLFSERDLKLNVDLCPPIGYQPSVTTVDWESCHGG
jgi:hypothetical protein